MTCSELNSLVNSIRAAQSARPHVPLALATLVAVDGSSYRQPGAVMLCDAEGRVLCGAISGGCLEGDVAQRARGVCSSGLGTVLSYDLHEDLETIWGLGMGCEGVAHIVLAPLAGALPFEEALNAANARASGALLTVVSSEDAHRVGEISFVRDAAPALALMPKGQAHARVQDTVLHTDRAFLGTQGGPADTTRVFGVPVRPPVQVVIVGASRGAEAMARVADACGWRVLVVDHRDTVLSSLHLPTRSCTLNIRAEDAATALTQGMCPSDSRTMFVLCTHVFEHDLAWLEAVISTRSTYIGVFGSRQRAARLLSVLTDAGHMVRARDRARVYAPIGLDIGGESPDEIALAAIAEMQSVLHSRPGGPLRERQAPVHACTETSFITADYIGAVCHLPAPSLRARR